MPHRSSDVLGQSVYLPKKHKKANHDIGTDYWRFMLEKKSNIILFWNLFQKLSPKKSLNIAIVSWEYKDYENTVLVQESL